METELLKAGEEGAVGRAAELLRQARVVAFPTETVYGLGVRADRPGAVGRLLRLKQRPAGKKFSRLIADPADMDTCAEPDERAQALAARFWPGPLTLVIPDGRGGDVGLRCADLELTRELVRRVGVALAAPSANVSGRPPAADAGQVLEAFGGLIAAVLDGGPARLGLASTVVRLTGPRAEILREAAIREEEIWRALGCGGG